MKFWGTLLNLLQLPSLFQSIEMLYINSFLTMNNREGIHFIFKLWSHDLLTLLKIIEDPKYFLFM